VRREHLEHLIRACADLTDEDNIVVVGSQAIHGSHADPPRSLLFSLEADVYPRDRPERADVIDGAIGEGSPFHKTFEYYAHGVAPDTAKAPQDWEARLVALSTPNTRGATGWCLEAHDLVLAKCVAGREKDWNFAAEALAHGIVELSELESRAPRLPVENALQEAIVTQLRAA